MDFCNPEKANQKLSKNQKTMNNANIGLKARRADILATVATVENAKYASPKPHRGDIYNQNTAPLGL